MVSKNSSSLSFFHYVRLIYTAFQGICFSCFGVFLFLLSVSPSIREKFAFFLENYSKGLLFFSFVFLALGALFLLKVFLKAKEKVLFLKKEVHSVVLKKSAIYDLLSLTFLNEEIKDIHSFQVEVLDSGLSVCLHFNKTPYDQQKERIFLVEALIERVLKEKLGYEGSLYLTASFE